MIRRTSSKITPSLVNAAQEEILLVKNGIHTETPPNDLDSVEECVNFESELDGTLSLRKPLILEEPATANTFSLFDKKHLLAFDNKHVEVRRFENVFDVLPTITGYYLVWYDKTGVQHTKALTQTQETLPNSNITQTVYILDFLTIVNSLTLQDCNLLSVIIDNTKFNTYVSPDSGLIYNDLNYGNKLKRIIKVYPKRNDTGDEEYWYFEIISPLLSNFTSNLDVGNANAFKVDLLADNPYAYRDLYGYGYYSATKIVPYAELRNDYTSSLTIKELTESLAPVNNSAGFKIISTVNKNENSIYDIILKAFITTSINTSLRFYCLWEESTDYGINWKPAEAFLSKYSTNENKDKLVYQSVMDITSEEFEKKLESADADLDIIQNYLVTKPMVLLNPTNDLSETDTVNERPDVLYIGHSNILKYYRFQIYVDSGKEITPATDIVKSVLKAYFGNVEDNIDDSGIIKYKLENCQFSNEGMIKIPESTSNASIKLDTKNNNYKITKVRIRLGTTSDTINIDNETNVPAGGEFIKDLSNSPVSTITIPFVTGVDAVGLIYSVSVTYTTPSNTETTSIYLHSTTAPFQLGISDKTELVKDLTRNRDDFFNSKWSYWENQIIAFGKDMFFRSDVDKFSFDLMNLVSFGTDIVKIIPWRQYLLIFTEKDITLADYNYSTDTYSYKIISNSIGVPKVDADTIVVILNSVYFKSGFKIYKLIPNLYSASDSILNLHVVSAPIEKLFVDKLSRLNQIHNFVYADAETYRLFIPVSSYNPELSVYKNTTDKLTYCFTYFIDRKVWTVQEYPLNIKAVEILSEYETFLRTDNGYYYFSTDLKTLLKNYYIAQASPVQAHPMTIVDDEEVEDLSVTIANIGYSVEGSTEDTTGRIVCAGNSDAYITLEGSYNKLPYSDYLNKKILELYSEIITGNYVSESDFDEVCQPTKIPFKVDFGQQATNYAIDKQYLETKFIFSTLQEKDCFPINIYISTNGYGFSTEDSSRIHIDANTDSAFWKHTLDDKGTLNTTFYESIKTEYDGIMRQMIVKYSGRGKTIRHIITGISNCKFKIYNLLVRNRVLPKKQ